LEQRPYCPLLVIALSLKQEEEEREQVFPKMYRMETDCAWYATDQGKCSILTVAQRKLLLKPERIAVA